MTEHLQAEAEALIEKFMPHSKDGDTGDALYNAKACALLCIGEILGEVGKIVFNYDMDDCHGDTSPTNTVIPYYNRLRSAIQNYKP